MLLFFQGNPVNKSLLGCFFWMFLLMSVSIKANAGVLDKKLKLKKQTYLVKDLMAEMARQCGVGIAYDSKKISPTTKIKVTKTNLTAFALLELMRQQAAICFRQRGNYVILIPTLPKRILRKKKIKILIEIPAKSDTLERVLLKDSLPTGLKKDSVTLAPKKEVPNFDYVQPPPPKPEVTYRNIPAFVKATFPKDSAKKEINFFNTDLLLEGGVMANEIFYLAPTANVGFRFFSLSGTLYRNQQQTYWRLGFQSTMPLGSKWSVCAGWQFGQGMKNNKDYGRTDSHVEFSHDTITVLQDTMKVDSVIITENTVYDYSTQNLKTLGKWSTVSISAKYKLSDALSVSTGLTYNVLRTTYSLADGTSVQNPSAYSSGQDVPTVLKTPHNLGGNDSFENRRWVGIQISILYTF